MDQISASDPKPGTSKQNDALPSNPNTKLNTQLNIQATEHIDEPMETDFCGPLPPFSEKIQSELGSDPNRSDQTSEQPEQVYSVKAKKHSDKRKHKVRAKYVSQSSSSEESESSVQVKKSSKAKRAMLPLSPYLKEYFEKFEQDIQASNLPEGKYIKPPASTAKWYKVGQPCFEDTIQELNSDFAKICISPKPSGAPMGKVPLQVLNNLNIRQGRTSALLTFPLLLLRLLLFVALPWKGTRTVSSLLGYETACDYFYVLNKRILIQQRALACLSKSLAHILQRELYTMGDTNLL